MCVCAYLCFRIRDKSASKTDKNDAKGRTKEALGNTVFDHTGPCPRCR